LDSLCIKTSFLTTHCTTKSNARRCYQTKSAACERKLRLGKKPTLIALLVRRYAEAVHQSAQPTDRRLRVLQV
jgi:hypothetical protein